VNRGFTLWVFKTGWLGGGDGSEGLGAFLGICNAATGVTSAVEMV